MSKKRLDRTIIEPGRRKHNKYERRNSNAEERAKAKSFCHKALLDEDFVEDTLIKKRKKVYKDFDDKLSPLMKWLSSKIGCNWNDIYSEIRDKFDTRTTPGRHIIFDHLLKSVDSNYSHLFLNPDGTSRYKYDFYLDDENVLRKRPYKRAKYSKELNLTETENWLDGKIVMQTGNKLYWCIPHNTLIAKFYRNGKLEYYVKRSRDIFDKNEYVRTDVTWEIPIYIYYKSQSCRQDKEFSKEDYAFWDTLSDNVKSGIVYWSPLNKQLHKLK